MKDYITLAMRTMSPGFHKELVETNVIHGAIGMATEAGELLDAVKKALFYNKPLDKTNLIEECGDILWYMAAVLKECGVTVDDCMERNIAKLEKRFPEKFTEDKAENRDLAAERAALEIKMAEPDPEQKKQMEALKRAGGVSGGKDGSEPTY